MNRLSCSSLLSVHRSDLEIGDLVFTRIRTPLFNSVADATGCWSNHVGIIVGHDGKDYVVAESRVPLSCTTSLQRFIRRSENRRYEIKRLGGGLCALEKQRVYRAAHARLYRLYHTGFDFDSQRQFCSKFVHEVLFEATGRQVGEVQRFHQLLRVNPDASLKFWRIWFFGRIPWQRRTLTPASQYCSALLFTV